MRRAVRSPITKAQFEGHEGPGIPKATSDQWRSFWAQADEVGDHYVWRGKRPVFQPAKGPEVSAREVAWVFDMRTLRAGETLKPKCGKPLCIRPEHQAVGRAS